MRARKASGRTFTPSPVFMIQEQSPPPPSPKLPYVGYLVLIGMIASWIAMSELLQTLQDDYNKPCFITAVVHSGYAWFFLPWACFWCYGRCSGEVSSVAERYGVKPCKLLAISLVMATLAFICAYAWYLSLTRTTVAANNSIYQSCAAIVYVFSVLLLGEKATWMKTSAVVVSIVGVIMVSTDQHASSADENSKALGYVYLMISVFAYALYEVCNKKYLEHDVVDADRAVTIQRSHSVALIDNDEDERRHRTGSDEHNDDWAHARGRRGSDSGVAILPKHEIVAAAVEDIRPTVGVSGGDVLSTSNSGSGSSNSGIVRTNSGGNRSGGSRRSSPRRVGNLILPDLTSTRLRIEMSCMMLGLYGVMTALFSLPLLAVWNAGKIEEFKSPPSHKLSLLLINTALDSTYNALLLFGILSTTPLFMSVGTMMVMPCSMVTDRLLHGTMMGPPGIMGAVVIVVGFTMLNIPQELASRWYAALARKCCGKA